VRFHVYEAKTENISPLSIACYYQQRVKQHAAVSSPLATLQEPSSAIITEHLYITLTLLSLSQVKRQAKELKAKLC